MVDLREACANGAPQVWPERPAISRSTGPAWPRTPTPMPRRSSASSSAAHVARVSLVHHQRIAVQSMEPRGATASYDPGQRQLFPALLLAERTPLRDGSPACWASPTQMRVITEDVGGAFGLKTGPYPEYLAMLVAARKIGRPVHWMSNRAEAFLSDNHARDAYSDVELALDERQIPGAAHAPPPAMGAYIGAGRRQHQHHQPDARACPACTTSRRSTFRALRLHQHDADRRLPRRRPAGGELRARARGRGSRARHRHRPGQLRKRNLIKPIGDAVQDRGQHHLSTAASSPAISTRRWSWPTSTASTSASARPQARREAARHRHFLHAGARRRVPTRRHLAVVPGRRPADARHERAIDRPGPCHVFSPLLAEQLGIPRGADRAQARRSGAGDTGYASVGSRSAMTATPRHDQDRGRDARSARARSPPRAREPAKATSNIATGASVCRHRPQDLAVRPSGRARQGHEEAGEIPRTSTPRTMPRRR